MKMIQTDLPGEIWRPVKGYTDRYISNMGRYRGQRGRVLSPARSCSGQLYIYVAYRQHIMVSRLVAEAFLRKPKDPLMYNVVHVNGNLDDNRACNLRYDYARDSDYRSEFRIAQVADDGSIVRTFAGIRCASRVLGVSYNSLAGCVYGQLKRCDGKMFRRVKAHR